jgi:hypothetical protein
MTDEGMVRQVKDNNVISINLNLFTNVVPLRQREVASGGIQSDGIDVVESAVDARNDHRQGHSDCCFCYRRAETRAEA